MAKLNPLPRSQVLQRASNDLRHYADALRDKSNRLIQRSRELRDRVRNFLEPPPPTSTA